MRVSLNSAECWDIVPQCLGDDRMILRTTDIIFYMEDGSTVQYDLDDWKSPLPPFRSLVKMQAA